MVIEIKRIYDEFLVQDGYRMLVDRLWPRGISKERASLDEWNKNIAPSTELRKWFGHIPEKYNEFRKRYYMELDNNPEAQRLLTDLRSKSKDNVVTLLYSAKDTERNQAVVLLEYLEKK